MKTECSMSFGRLDNVCEMWLLVFGCFVLLRNKISLTKINKYIYRSNHQPTGMSGILL